MIIEKNAKLYTVKENNKNWVLTNTASRVLTISIEVDKAEYPTFEELKAFVFENELF